jgi:hypothetical protein
MDLYTFSLFLGAAGLLTMALQGIGSGHGDHAGGHSTDAGHAGHGGHAGHHGHSADAHSGHGTDAHSSSQSHGHDSAVGKFLWSFASPRVWFSVLLGMGLAGRATRPFFEGGPMLFVAALGLGLLFEGIVVRPVWNLVFKFASKPALSLESCVEDEATAVTSFDKNGQGIISVDLDGQMVQLLATLRADDRALGAAVRAGDRVRIADVDSARNQCTVAVL